jgi:hypothetical protein
MDDIARFIADARARCERAALPQDCVMRRYARNRVIEDLPRALRALEAAIKTLRIMDEAETPWDSVADIALERIAAILRGEE